MANEWIQHLKNALYVAEKFLNEKKPGVYPPEALRVVAFAGVLLHNDLSVQVWDQLKQILMNEVHLERMRTGLITRSGSKPLPGAFFKFRGATISVKHEGTVYYIDIHGMLAALTTHGQVISDTDKSLRICLYVTDALARMFCIFILQNGANIGMQKADRDAIVSSTITEYVPEPYQQGQQMAALKTVAMKFLDMPLARKTIEEHVGPGSSETIKSAIKSADGGSISRIGDALTKTIADQDPEHVMTAVADFVSTTSNGIHASDGIESNDQD